MPTAPAHKSRRAMTKGQQAPISKEDFLLLYSDKDDGYKYELNNGVVETTSTLNQQQLIIQNILLRLFLQSKVFQNGGLLAAEGDMDTSSTQLRRPYLAIYSKAQLEKIKKGENQVALWVGEIISEHDNINKVNAKLEEYFNAGVKVVWHIFPILKQVHVYTAVDNVSICRGETICSGEPAVDNFEITAEALFE